MDPFIGEIRLMAFAYDTSDGWLLCDGRIFQTTQNPALFSLIGNAYGGDGQTTFAIPDLRGRVAMQFNPSYKMGNMGGSESVVLTQLTMPQHTHGFNATSETADKPGVGTSASRLLGTSTANLYGSSTNMVAMNEDLSSSGSSLGHNNMQPSLVLAYCIASKGLYPPRE